MAEGKSDNSIVTHEAANTINSLVDNLPHEGQTDSEFATAQFTPALEFQAIKTLVSDNALERLKEQIAHDEKTGLFSSRQYEEDISMSISDEVKKNPDGSWSVNDKKLSQIQVLQLDIGFLGYANTLAGRMDAGDKYKKALADITGGKTKQMQDFLAEQGISLKAYTMSKGDEYGIIASCSKEKALLLAKKIQEEIGYVQMGFKSELPSSISIGLISAEEFVHDFLQYYDQEGLKPEEFSGKYGFVITKIADFRSEYDKYIQRIDLMRILRGLVVSGKIKESRYNYLRNYYVAKGAIGVAEDELDMWITSEEKNHDNEGFKMRTNEWLRKILKRRNETYIERADTPLENYVAMKEKEIIESNNFI